MTCNNDLYKNFGMPQRKPQPDLPYRRIQGANFCCELPRSTQPWRLVSFRGGIIATNPEHPPMRIVAGKAEPISNQGVKS